MLTSLEATKIAREAVDVLIEKPIETVVGCDLDNDGFLFSVEVCDMKAHIADNDLLAIYEIKVDRKSGEILRYARTSRFRRGDASASAA